MGLDSDGTKFLFAARAAGVSFRNTATLGRQNFFPEPAQLQRLLDLQKPGLSAKEFLADSRGYAEKFLELPRRRRSRRTRQLRLRRRRDRD